MIKRILIFTKKIRDSLTCAEISSKEKKKRVSDTSLHQEVSTLTFLGTVEAQKECREANPAERSWMLGMPPTMNCDHLRGSCTFV